MRGETSQMLPYDCCVALRYLGREICSEYTAAGAGAATTVITSSSERHCSSGGDESRGDGEFVTSDTGIDYVSSVDDAEKKEYAWRILRQKSPLGQGVGSDRLLTFLLEFGEEKLRHYFVPVEGRRWLVGSTRDAVEALEFMATMVQAHKFQQQTCEAFFKSSTLIQLTPQIFSVATADVPSLKVTDLVRLFALLRILRHSLRPLECNRVARILVRGLRHHDARVINPYHILKVILTLQRLPVKHIHRQPDGAGRVPTVCKTLLPAAAIPVCTTTPNSDSGGSSATSTKVAPLLHTHLPPPALRTPAVDPMQSEALWDYVVSKVCLIFGSMAQREQAMVFNALEDTLRRRGLQHLMAALHNEKRLALQSLRCISPTSK